jgi:hypothetical protein
VAAAQSCHLPPENTGTSGIVAGLRGESAGFDTKSYEGHYEGTALLANLETRWFRANAVLPAYRIVRNGLAATGFGDVLLQGGVALLRGSEPRRTLGVELGVSLPTGSVENDLGMGHVMVLPSVWGGWQAGALGFSARAGYARALAGSGHAHHHQDGHSPIVDPMNSSELALSAVGSLELARIVALRAGAYGAVPVGISDGAGRAAALVAAGLGGRRVASELQVQLPLAGDPFSAKLLLELRYRF